MKFTGVESQYNCMLVKQNKLSRGHPRKNKEQFWNMVDDMLNKLYEQGIDCRDEVIVFAERGRQRHHIPISLVMLHRSHDHYHNFVNPAKRVKVKTIKFTS